jgi:hypothetical protein
VFTNDPSQVSLVITDSPQHDQHSDGFGFTAVLPGGFLPFFDYEALVADEHASQHIFTVGLRKEF